MEKNKYKKGLAPMLPGPMDHPPVCRVCECEYEPGGEGSSEGMCPDCYEAYQIWHEATGWTEGLQRCCSIGNEVETLNQ